MSPSLTSGLLKTELSDTPLRLCSARPCSVAADFAGTTSSAPRHNQVDVQVKDYSGISITYVFAVLFPPARDLRKQFQALIKPRGLPAVDILAMKGRRTVRLAVKASGGNSVQWSAKPGWTTLFKGTERPDFVIFVWFFDKKDIDARRIFIVPARVVDRQVYNSHEHYHRFKKTRRHAAQGRRPRRYQVGRQGHREKPVGKLRAQMAQVRGCVGPVGAPTAFLDSMRISRVDQQAACLERGVADAFGTVGLAGGGSNVG